MIYIVSLAEKSNFMYNWGIRQVNQLISEDLLISIESVAAAFGALTGSRWKKRNEAERVAIPMIIATR